MDIKEECLNRLVQLDEDIEGTVLTKGLIGLVTADLPDDSVFAVWFNSAEVGKPSWYTFKDYDIKEKFTLINEEEPLLIEEP